MAKLPYYHLLPILLYKLVLRIFGEKQNIIDGLVEIKETGIFTDRFKKICKQNNYRILKQIKYLIAPIYEYKFGYKTKLLPKWLGAIPFINDFFTFQSYYIIKK